MELFTPNSAFGNGTDFSARHRDDLVESSSDAIIGLAADGKILSWNGAAERLFNLGEAEAIGSYIASAKPDLAAAGVDSLLRETMAGRNCPPVDIYPPTAGVGLSIAISPIRERSGRVTGASLIARDISDRLRDQQHQTLVVHELNHRVKNTLAVVQAIARQMFKDLDDPASSGAQFLDMLRALSHTQNMLDQNSWRGLSVREVATEQVAPYAGASLARCSIDGPSFILKPSAAVALGMAFHELATNSAKYGAFSVPTGRVTLSWKAEGKEADRRLTLCWREFEGPLVNPPQRRGLGSRMLEHGLALELGGRAELTFHRTGIWYSLVVPLPLVESS
jgi:PAS domain S-box-containing protein